MGDVWVRPEDHGTGVDGLYAIGEAASGLHGANLVWAGPGRVDREAIPAVPAEISSLMREVSTTGKLME
jgi:FAD binding domain